MRTVRTAVRARAARCPSPLAPSAALSSPTPAAECTVYQTSGLQHGPTNAWFDTSDSNRATRLARNQPCALEGHTKVTRHQSYTPTQQTLHICQVRTQSCVQLLQAAQVSRRSDEAVRQELQVPAQHPPQRIRLLVPHDGLHGKLAMSCCNPGLTCVHIADKC